MFTNPGGGGGSFYVSSGFNVVYDTFSIANSYTKTESDTRYPFKGNNSIIHLNGQTISADITIDSDENGVSAGPITQSATVTVNGYWSIV